MPHPKAMVCLLVLCASALIAPCQAQVPPTAAADEPESEAEPPVPPAELDLDSTSTDPRLPRPRLMEDPRIKIQIDPLIVGSLVDRVSEPSTIRVEAAGAERAYVYLVPVDAPYGGKPTGKARLLGIAEKAADGFKVTWDSPEPHKYVKIFAVVERKNAPGKSFRSKSLDIAVAAARYQPKSGQPDKP